MCTFLYCEASVAWMYVYSGGCNSHCLVKLHIKAISYCNTPLAQHANTYHIVGKFGWGNVWQLWQIMHDSPDNYHFLVGSKSFVTLSLTKLSCHMV